MLHGNTAICFIPCIHGIGFEQVQEKNFPCNMIHEIIICLYIVLLPNFFVEVYDKMSIFGDTFVQLADEFFDRVNIFDCSFENSTIEEVGVGKDSLEKPSHETLLRFRGWVPPYLCGKNILRLLGARRVSTPREFAT